MAMTEAEVRGLRKTDAVAWRTLSRIQKKGLVMCHVPKGADVRAVVKAAGMAMGTNDSLKSSEVSTTADRVLVLVYREGSKAKGVDFHCPSVSQLMTSGQKLTAEQMRGEEPIPEEKRPRFIM